MKNNKSIVLCWSLLGIGQLYGADEVPFTVMIGNAQYELPSGSGPFVEIDNEPFGLIAVTKSYALLSSVFAYNAEKKCVEPIKEIPVVTQEEYLALCDSEPADLELYAIQRAGCGLFGLRLPAGAKRKIKSEMCSIAILSGYSNFYLNKEYFDMPECAK